VAPQPLSTWNLPNTGQGYSIERVLGANLPKNFPTIDRWVPETGKAISIKSMDVTAPSYQSSSNILSKLNSYTRAVSDFAKSATVEFNDVRIAAEQVASRELHVAVPEMTPALRQVVGEATEYAATRGVQLLIFVVQ
jgi:hypothetical protein